MQAFKMLNRILLKIQHITGYFIILFAVMQIITGMNLVGTFTFINPDWLLFFTTFIFLYPLQYLAQLMG